MQQVDPPTRLPYRKETSALGRDTKAIGERAMDVSTLTAKAQVTVPKEVRKALGLRQGDHSAGSWRMARSACGQLLRSIWPTYEASMPACRSGAAQRMRKPSQGYEAV